MTQPQPERDPRQSAAEYRQLQQGEETTPKPRPKSDGEWQDLIAHRIDEAMKSGHFDNLPGRGKPLNLDRNPYAPEGSEMAFDLLKNNNLAPAWIGLRRELLRDLDRWSTRLAELVFRYGAEFAAASAPAAVERVNGQWASQRQALGLEVDALNKRIVNLNLQQPVAHLELLKLRLEDKLRAAGAGDWA